MKIRNQIFAVSLMMIATVAMGSENEPKVIETWRCYGSMDFLMTGEPLVTLLRYDNYVVDGLGVCAVGRLAPRKTGDVLPKVQPGIPDGISGNGRFQIPASARFSIVRVRVLSRFPGINPPVAFASA